MFKNSFKITLQYLSGPNSFTVINMAGLCIAIACSLLSFTGIKHEVSRNKLQPEYDHIYEVLSKDNFEEEIINNARISISASGGIKLEFPQITM